MAETTSISTGQQQQQQPTATAAGASHPDSQQEHELETMGSGSTSTSTDQPRAGFKKYYMEYTTSRLNARLHRGSMTGPVDYFLHTSITLTSPQLLLRRGDSKESPVTAFCKLQNLSRHALLGRGDYEKLPAEQLVWEGLQREKNVFQRSDYQFGTEAGGGGGRSEYYWRKDRSRMNRTIYDCVDEKGEVVARMLSGGAFNWKRAGDVDVREGLDQALEEWLIISATAVWAYEALAYQSIFQGFESENKDKDKKKN